MAVSRRLRHDLRADDAAASRTVVDDEGLSVPLAELLCEHPADRVGATTGRERDDQAHRALGIAAALRGGGARHQHSQEHGDGQTCCARGARATMVHWNSSEAAGPWIEDFGTG